MQSWTSGILAGLPAADRKYTTGAHFQAVARRIVLRRQNSGQQAYEDKTTEISLQTTNLLCYKDPPIAEVNYSMVAAPSIISLILQTGVPSCNLAVSS
jgi:hypothetical protein